MAAHGLFLSKEDFGLYAISFSIAAFAQIFRDGGVVQLLVQRGETAYRSLLGPVFWMALAFNFATALVLAGIAPFVARGRHEPDLLWLLIVIGLSMPLATPAVVLQARLAMKLRFDVVSRIQLISAFIRYGGTISLAWFGFGPLSFVLPLPVIALYEGVASYIAVREAPWRHSPQFHRWRDLFVQSKWLVFTAFATASLNQGGYLVLSALVDKSVIGVFFFAYQLIGQVDSLLSSTAAVVLFPALARLADEPARFRAAVRRSARMLMLLAAPATAALVVGFGPFETILWHGKWEAARWPCQAISLFYASRILFMVPGVAMQSLGQFRAAAFLVLFCGLGVMLATTIGAFISPTPDTIAWWLGSYFATGCLGFSLWGLSKLQISVGTTLRDVMPAWISAWIGAGAALAADYVIKPLLVGPAQTAFRIVEIGNPSWAKWSWLPQAVAAVPRLVLVGLILTAVFMLILRFCFSKTLREGVGLVPARFQALVFRLLALPA